MIASTKGLFTVQGHRAVLDALGDATNDDDATDDDDDDESCSGYDSDSDIDDEFTRLNPQADALVGNATFTVGAAPAVAPIVTSSTAGAASALDIIAAECSASALDVVTLVRKERENRTHGWAIACIRTWNLHTLWKWERDRTHTRCNTNVARESGDTVFCGMAQT